MIFIYYDEKHDNFICVSEPIEKYKELLVAKQDWDLEECKEFCDIYKFVIQRMTPFGITTTTNFVFEYKKELMAVNVENLFFNGYTQAQFKKYIRERFKETQVFVLNGKATSGKDTFFEIFKEQARKHGKECIKTSIIDKPKQMLKLATDEVYDFNQEKNEEYRSCLSRIKLSLEELDLNFKILQGFIECYQSNRDYIFIDMREEKDIKRALDELNVKTVWIERNVKNITSNVADANVEQFKDYDYIIDNNGSLCDLEKEVVKFLNEVGVMT